MVQFLGEFANTTPLTGRQWLASVLLGLVGMPIAVVVKLIPVGSS
jgi:Ca2+-transporting ATPase